MVTSQTPLVQGTEADDLYDGPDGRLEQHAPRTVGERVADAAASGIGSWRFIIVQTLLVIIWVAINAAGWRLHWDPYPFILLNLMFSVQAAYTGPILLLANNRQAAIDRQIAARDDEEIGLLVTMQQEQMHILALLKQSSERQMAIIEMLHERSASQQPANP
ncbi:MAG TPA: DUF1003 domain-containing protein [Chloroflexota bacterium]|nr:DUF1003 domain-containing protein [Chloroflexota bacterium]